MKTKKISELPHFGRNGITIFCGGVGTGKSNAIVQTVSMTPEVVAIFLNVKLFSEYIRNDDVTIDVDNSMDEEALVSSLSVPMTTKGSSIFMNITESNDRVQYIIAEIMKQHPNIEYVLVFNQNDQDDSSLTEYIRMCKQKKIDLILTKSISRFARNTVDCLEYVRILKELGIGVIFEKENINTLTMTSEFMIALYGSFAQAESESISKNVSFGVQMGFKEGKVRYNFKHLLGYKRGEDNMPVIVPEEAEIIRKIFDMFLDGVSMKDIARTLERQGCRTKLGKTEWTTGNIRNILTNEKYVGDVLMQKTYTVDCITHKVAKNNGERAMYLASDCHPAIIDRNAYNLVQQELARRNAKRKVSTKTVTEQGKYSSKYALTELMICGECGTPYRRCTWTVHGKKQIVWRCISRLDHGSKYCKSSPTIHEEPLHRAIVQAVNEFYDCGDDVAKILKANVESVLAGMEQSEIQKIEQRLKDIDKARNDMISLITSGSCNEDNLDAEFAKLYEEETQLSGKLMSLKAQCKVSDDTKDKIESTIAEIENSRFQLEAFDDVLIRKLIECVKVISKTEIIIIFKGGYEVKAEVDKK